MKNLLALVVCSLGAGVLLAQTPREPHVAIVSDADGKVVAGAEVTFVATEGTGRAAEDDVVRAISNEHGRVRVELQGGRQYMAYAALAVAGGTRHSALEPRAPTTTELVLAAGPVQSHTLVVTGFEAWRERGPVEIEFEPFGCAALAQRVPVAADGSVQVGTQVNHFLQVRVFVAGRLVYADFLYTLGTLTANEATLRLPPPHEISCVVRDEAGAPVAGAELLRIANGWHGHDGAFPGGFHARRWAVGTTDADGRATLLLAQDKEPFGGVDDFPGVVFVASKDGCRETWSGFTSVVFGDGKAVDKKTLDGVLPFTLRPAATAQVALRARGQTPPCVIVHVAHTVPDGDSDNVARDLVTYPVDAEGRFAMRAPREGIEITSLVVPGVVPPVANDDPFARLGMGRTMVVAPGALDASGGLDLRAVVALRLQLIDAGGGPARGAAVLCSPWCGERYVQAQDAMRATADAAGRVLLPVLPGRCLVFALHEGAIVRVELDVDADLPVQTHKLELLPSATVLVTDGTVPVAGASLRFCGGSWSGQDDPAEAFVTNMAHHVDSWLLRRVRTDAEGKAMVRLLPAKGVQAMFRAHLGGKSSAEHWLVAGQHFDLVLR